MDESRLKEIEARAENAYPGPWEVIGVGHKMVQVAWENFGQKELIGTGGNFKRTEDVIFIAHARQDIPDLIAEIRRLKEENGNLKLNFVRLSEMAESLYNGWLPLVESHGMSIPNDIKEYMDKARKLKDDIIERSIKDTPA